MNSYLIGKYSVIVYTGDVDNAGTDANVAITLYGCNAQCGPENIDNMNNNFEKNA